MILEIVLRARRLFQCDQGDDKRTFDAQSFICQKKGIGGIRNAYIRFDSVGPGQTVPNMASSWMCLGPGAPKSLLPLEQSVPQKFLRHSIARLTDPFGEWNQGKFLPWQKGVTWLVLALWQMDPGYGTTCNQEPVLRAPGAGNSPDSDNQEGVS